MEQPPGIMWISRACVELALSLTECSILESWLHFSLVPALRRVGLCFSQAAQWNWAWLSVGQLTSSVRKTAHCGGGS